MNRRQFFRNAAAAGVVLQAPFVLAQSPARKFRTALIGCGWWGRNILKEAMAGGSCRIAALCDVDSATLETTAEQVTDQCGDKPKTYVDFRELLERERPEIVIIATPDHWHALQSIAALQSGAHLFVEKPTGHTVMESQAMLKVARQSGRTVQTGLHRRIGPHHVEAMKFLKSGAVGEVGMVRLFADSGGGREKPAPNSAPPEEMNWDLWCGPAPRRPFNRKLHPGGWRNFLDYANGTMGDWGVHWLDQVLWWSEEKSPRHIYCVGGREIAGRPILNDKEQTTDAPDHQVAVFEFQNFTCLWEHRHFAGNGAEKHQLGAYFYGTKGTLHIGWRDGWTFYPVDGAGRQIHGDAQLQEPDGHNLKLLWADFLDAIAQNRPPVAGIEIAHRASILPLLAMVSWKMGRSIEWDGDKEQIISDPHARLLLSRPYRAPWQYPTV